ncbi:MAG: hypothetical protein Q9190_002900 [Brigantiaea leucoxantha]
MFLKRLQSEAEIVQSKQYLTTHTIDHAHETDIFSIAVTTTQVISASGSSNLKVHSITEPEFTLSQNLNGAHKLGCHHLTISKNGEVIASAGFAGELLLWVIEEDQWVRKGSVLGMVLIGSLELSIRDQGLELLDGNKPGEMWALALSADGQYLATTSVDGRINSLDGRYTVSGHENGGVYVFNNDSGRLLHSLAGLVKPVRAVAFSPGSKLLAAAGDANIIALYDVSSGEQIANFSGHQAWIFSLDWNTTGEYLLSGGFDGKAKVWSIDQRSCVATHSETEKAIWSVKWLPKVGKNEGFATAGANKSISFYREALGR